MDTTTRLNATLFELGGRLRLARERRRWSRDSLAKRMNIARQTVERMEHGDPGIRVGTLINAMLILDLPMEPIERIADPSQDVVGLSNDIARGSMQGKRAPADPRDEFDFGRTRG